MMSFEEELVDLLQADASVLATVSTRIWPVAIRLEPTFPAITYGRESGGREYALDASVVRQEATMVVRCWAHEYPTARVLADDVAEALDRNTSTAIDVVTVTDGADVWLDGHDVFGCTLLVRMEMHL
jgi:hypothetical protein